MKRVKLFEEFIESVVTEAKTISFAKASMLGSKLLNKIKIGTILDTKGGQYEVTGFGQQSNAFKEFEATIDGKEVKVKLTAMYGLKLEVTDDVRSARFNKEEEINSIILESLVTEAKTLDRDEMMDWLDQTLTFTRTSEEFDGSKDGIWTTGENGEQYKGKIIYDYYSQDYKNRTFGVLNSWEKELNKRGWYSEWYDAGTVMIWQD